MDVDQREGSDSDEGEDVILRPTLYDEDGNNWNFLNLALCLRLKVSRKLSPGEGL